VAVRGQTDASVLLSSKLSPAALVRLACDLLFLRGHTEIRITDGPGDGGRDIHSVSSEGHKHLTQCKFHKRLKQTASSAELSELPMAMVKLGYSQGLFVTNARISPQGKREYLDNYPQLRLEFLDGDTIASQVFDTGLLKAVWFDGKSIAAVNTAITFSTIIRRHSDDASILPFRFDDFPPPDDCIKYLSNRYPDIKFTMRHGRVEPAIFEPYRAPEPFTKEEGAFPSIDTLDIIAAGDVALYKIEGLSRDICHAILLWQGDGITVRIGTPALMPLTGENSGARILLKAKAKSFIATRWSCGEELDWFSFNGNQLWDTESDARVTEAAHIRLYNWELDCVASYEIRSRPSAQQRSHSELMHELMLHGWQRSIFALVPADYKWDASGVPPPDETGEWPWDGRIICGWFHWRLLGGPMDVRTAAPSRIDDLWHTPSDEEEAVRLEPIRSAIEKIPGTEILDPIRARHMVALIGADLLDVQRSIVFPTAEVLNYPEDIPSPIHPQARRFGFSVAWRGNVATNVLETVVRETSETLRCGYLESISVTRYEQDLLLNASVLPSDLDASPSDLILADLHISLSVLLPRVEKSEALTGTLHRCTREFWLRCFNVSLGTSPEQSKKVYAMVEPSNGDLSPLGLPPELLQRKRKQ